MKKTILFALLMLVLPAVALADVSLFTATDLHYLSPS